MYKTGIELITKEREEQLFKHKWNNDSIYTNNELIYAAMQYLGGGDIDCWPETWDKKWHKPNRKYDYTPSRIDELKIAGALIAAEIDRIQGGKNDN